MDTLLRDVKDIAASDRQTLERLLGARLRDDQRVMIRVVDGNGRSSAPPTEGDAPSKLPDWCAVYAGLSEEEVDGIERTILNRADLSRSCE